MDRDLFSDTSNTPSEGTSRIPLADRMRPRTLEEVVGQDHLLAEGKLLREVVTADEVPSLIFWGPPGVGKTTLARIMAHRTNAHFLSISAVLSGVKDVRKIVEEARYQQKAFNRNTLLFVDEIHRFNKAQQDAFLPHVESGLLTLIGATTENPSFEVIAPLLSRTRVVVLNSLEQPQLVLLLERALRDEEKGLGRWRISASGEVLDQIAAFADGDARRALNILEAAAALARRLSKADPRLSPEIVAEAMQRRTLLYDKSGEEHFNLISALHKSMRNSDADASIYWLARMLEAGEDPLYIARRLVRFASEDIGLADPQALSQALNAMQAFQFIGLPEGKLALAQAAVYLALAPKSNAIYEAYSQVQRDVETSRNEPVPLHLRNAPTPLMKEFGYGSGYRYAHDEPEAVTSMECLPPELRDRRYYRPGDQGHERQFRARLEELFKLRKREEGSDS